MTKRFGKLFLVLSMGTWLAACQETDGESGAEEPETEAAQETEAETGAIAIEGLGHHYHTGDPIELTATVDPEVEYDHWHWYTRADEAEEWEAVSGAETEAFEHEAPEDSFELQAILYTEDEEVFAESEIAEVVIDNHHGNDEESRRVYNGFFYNDEVADRELSDWEGDWQSVYPYLLAGDLDEVMEAKAEESEDMTTEEYYDYYAEGYETDIDRIVIEDDSFTFYSEDGEEHTAAYTYDGYEILTYERGNRGVRFVFERSDDVEDMPRYIQFSDHEIQPQESHHFHLYWGDDRGDLLEEVVNWPTYYPSEYSTDEVIRDMLAH